MISSSLSLVPIYARLRDILRRCGAAPAAKRPWLPCSGPERGAQTDGEVCPEMEFPEGGAYSTFLGRSAGKLGD